MASFVERMIGAATLNVATYEEVERDVGATAQASLVVVLSSIGAGLGVIREGGVLGIGIGTVAALIGWYIWAFITYIVGTKMLPEPATQSNMGELLRTTGFSAAPGVLRVLAAVPGLGWALSFAASLWMLVAMVVAVRQALDYQSTGRAIAVCLIGFVIQLAFLFAVAMFMGLVLGIGIATLGGR